MSPAPASHQARERPVRRWPGLRRPWPRPFRPACALRLTHVFCPVPDFWGSLPRCLHTKAGGYLDACLLLASETCGVLTWG